MYLYIGEGGEVGRGVGGGVSPSLSWAVVVDGSQDFGKCISKGKSNMPRN